MEKNIALIRGDGIGPEIVNQAVLVLDRVAEIYGHSFSTVFTIRMWIWAATP